MDGGIGGVKLVVCGRGGGKEEESWSTKFCIWDDTCFSDDGGKMEEREASDRWMMIIPTCLSVQHLILFSCSLSRRGESPSRIWLLIIVTHIKHTDHATSYPVFLTAFPSHNLVTPSHKLRRDFAALQSLWGGETLHRLQAICETLEILFVVQFGSKNTLCSVVEHF